MNPIVLEFFAKIFCMLALLNLVFVIAYAVSAFTALRLIRSAKKPNIIVPYRKVSEARLAQVRFVRSSIKAAALLILSILCGEISWLLWFREENYFFAAMAVALILINVLFIVWASYPYLKERITK